MDGKNVMDKKQIPHISKSAQQLAGSGGAPAGLGWHSFFKLPLFHRSKSIWKKRKSQIQSLDSRKARRFTLALGRRPGLFPALYRFLWSYGLEAPSDRIGPPLGLKVLGSLKQASISHVLERFYTAIRDAFTVRDRGRPDFWSANGVGVIFEVEMDHTVKSLHRLLSGSTKLRVWCGVVHQFLVNMKKRSKLSATVVDSILPLWCSWERVKDAVFSEEEMEQTLELDGQNHIPSLFAGSKGEGRSRSEPKRRLLSHGP